MKLWRAIFRGRRILREVTRQSFSLCGWFEVEVSGLYCTVMQTKKWFSDLTIVAMFLGVTVAQSSHGRHLRRFAQIQPPAFPNFASAFIGRADLLRESHPEQNSSEAVEVAWLVAPEDSGASRARITPSSYEHSSYEQRPSAHQQEHGNSPSTAEKPDTTAGAPDVPVTTKGQNSQPDPNDYIIGEQDALMITVWKEKEISGGVVVRPDGKITVPLVGEIKVVGMTPVQLQDLLVERLKPFVTVPQVSVAVTQINSRKVYLIGQAAREGSFTINSSTTVLQVITQAGGLKDFAKRKKIYILRNQGQKQTRFSFDYDAVIRGNKTDQNILLQPGDTIVVP